MVEGEHTYVVFVHATGEVRIFFRDRLVCMYDGDFEVCHYSDHFRMTLSLSMHRLNHTWLEVGEFEYVAEESE